MRVTIQSLCGLFGEPIRSRIDWIETPFLSMPVKALTASVVTLVASTFAFAAQNDASLTLQVLPPASHGWVRLDATGQTDAVLTLQATTDWIQWTPIATTHESIAALADPATQLFPNRFYRLALTNRTSLDDWKNQIGFPNDRFLSTAGMTTADDFRWVKFAIQLDEPFRVYFQDSQKYDFHYDFASARLEAFRGMTPAQFDQVALHTNEQRVLLGTVLFPPYPNETEFGIQFVGLDAYEPEFLARYFQLVESTVAAGSNVRAFYVPTFEQARAAETHRAYFESKGIRLTTAARWLIGDDVYSTGWALGRLKFFPGAEINAAFRDGRLSPQDILLTDGVPAEIPVLAGVLTLTPSTPNSHVAILAKSFGLPFAYLSDPVQRDRVQQLIGKDIVLRLNPFTYEVKVLELESSMDPALREEILGLKAPPELEIVPTATFGALSASTDQLNPADIKFFGGKASNYGFLRRTIPERSQPAIGISFDLWEAFLDQVLPGGQTLRAAIAARLSKYSYPPNVQQLSDDLRAVRDLIKDTAQFPEAQKLGILEALRTFEPTHNVRFRSSTNVEDSEQFTGAGLYDSYSGCIADDLDADSQGPSLCDPTEADERGVFRAIKKVYASFYNDNAFIERLRHHLDERTVGMAMLVHRSAPDKTELANGVATIQVDRNSPFTKGENGDLVTQKGAVSVTNPDGNAKPEVVQGYHHAQGAGGFLRQRSSLVPLGAYVMEWQSNYVELMSLFAKVADAYHEYFPAKKEFTLDFEYKKLIPGVLDVKQVREVPVSTSTNLLPSYLVHAPNGYWVYQGEAADVFSNHRLKSFWSFQTRNTKLTETNLLQSIFTHLNAEYLQGRQTNQLSSAPGELADASHGVEGDLVIDRWSTGSGADRREEELRVDLSRNWGPTAAPIYSLADFRVEWVVKFATPQPALEWDFDGPVASMMIKHSVMLEPRRAFTTNHVQLRTFKAGAVKINTEFYWPGNPSRGIGEKTAPLVGWKETRIEGFTTEPIVLRGEYSQTYRPGHHNFSEEFIFEPVLEGNLSPQAQAELQAANVQLIHAFVNFDRQQVRILGLNGQFRSLE